MTIHTFRERALAQYYSDSYAIPVGTRNIIIGIAASSDGGTQKRGVFVSYTFRDEFNNVALPTGTYLESPRAGTFFYVNLVSDEGLAERFTVAALVVPPGAQRLELTGASWLKKTVVHFDEVHILSLDGDGLTPEREESLPAWIQELAPAELKLPWARRFPDRARSEPGNTTAQDAWSVTKEIKPHVRSLSASRDFYQPGRPAPAHRIKVALICDEFTYNSFSPEFEPCVLDPDTWREQLERFSPALFLCESAWSGVDSKSRPWRGKIYGSVKFRGENRTTLFEILDYCKKNGIPTVFWNKEDPTHHHDRVNDFVSTAARFDYVLTTAEESVPGYAKFMAAGHVGVMPFAAQPRIFNPLVHSERSPDAVFAGAWYEVHDARKQTMQEGLEYVARSGVGLTIYDRNYGTKSRDLMWPHEYAPYLHPAVPHRATARLYKQHAMGLNFNTVTESTTMFARRVFELAASGCLIVTNRSRGLDAIYGESVINFDVDPAPLDSYSVSDRLLMTRRAVETTFASHTYRHRFETVLRLVGIPFTSSRPKPTCLIRVHDVSEIDRAVDGFREVATHYSRLLLCLSRAMTSEQVGRAMATSTTPMVDVVSERMVQTEGVPTSNYMSTPDVITAEPGRIPSGDQVERLMLHGEYTELPVRRRRDAMGTVTAGSLEPDMRITAQDAHSYVVGSDAVQPILEVE